jgi:hypothetical protein
VQPRRCFANPPLNRTPQRSHVAQHAAMCRIFGSAWHAHPQRSGSPASNRLEPDPELDGETMTASYPAPPEIA